MILQFGSEIKEKDGFKKSMDQISRKMSLFIGRYAYDIITSGIEGEDMLANKGAQPILEVEGKPYNP